MALARLECLGGLTAQDESFACTDICKNEFWEEVYDVMSLDKKHRDAVWHQVERGLTEGVNQLEQPSNTQRAVSKNLIGVGEYVQ